MRLARVPVMVFFLGLGFAPTSRAATAADWKATFPPSSVASFFEMPTAIAVVLADGDANAARALEDAFVHGGKATVVLNGTSLGAVTGLDDQSIVKKAATLPVQRIAVVRVFDDRAVVTVYDPAGKAITAFSGVAGTPMAAKENSVSSGVSASVESAVASVVHTDDAPSTAKETYADKALSLEGVTFVNENGQIVKRATDIVQGKFERPVSLDVFFTLVKRPDLLHAYQSRSALKLGLFLGGVAALVGGGVGLYLGLRPVTDCASISDACEALEKSQTVSPWLVTGIGLGLVSGFLFAGAALDPNPVASDEMRRLVDEYNRNLRQELGLPPEDARSDASTGPQLAFAPTPGGGAMSLSLRF